MKQPTPTRKKSKTKIGDEPTGRSLKNRMKQDNAETSESRNYFRSLDDFDAKKAINKSATKARIDQRRKEINKAVDEKMAKKKVVMEKPKPKMTGPKPNEKPRGKVNLPGKLGQSGTGKKVNLPGKFGQPMKKTLF